MDKLNEVLVDLVMSLGETPDICSKFKEDPSDENGDVIIKNIEEIEKKLLKVKENVVRIVRDVEDTVEEVNVLPSENGYRMNLE